MINVLVSTTMTQGAAPGDFCWVPEGELVARYGMVCASERPDGSGCGCGRAFAGLTTHKATTTAMVAEVDLTEAAWRAALHQTLVDTGWAQWSTADELAEWIDELVAIDLRSAAQMAPGTILGRRAYNEPDGTIQDMFLDRLRSGPRSAREENPTDRSGGSLAGWAARSPGETWSEAQGDGP